MVGTLHTSDALFEQKDGISSVHRIIYLCIDTAPRQPLASPPPHLCVTFCRNYSKGYFITLRHEFAQSLLFAVN